MKLPTKQRLREALSTAIRMLRKGWITIIFVALRWRKIVALMTAVTGSTWFACHMGWIQPIMDALSAFGTGLF